jgi:hypothetical protein
VRLFFSLRHEGYLRHFGSTIELLGERGHEIVLVIGGQRTSPEPIDRLLAHLDASMPGLSLRRGIETHRRVERDLAWALRHWMAYLWFFEPELDRASKARERLRRGLPPALLEATDAAATNAAFRHSLTALLSAVERVLPVPEQFTEFVAEEQPDAVLVSPLLERGIPQVNYLRAARKLGIPTGLCVASWDNLTNKGPILDPVDLVAVWNRAQMNEAVELHRVSPERIVITGAPLYDAWFDRKPSADRSEFCARLGLPADRPYLLYVCSSGFIAPEEAGWILRWIERLRASQLRELVDVPVLIRPHPRNRLLNGSSEARRLSTSDGVLIHPPEGEMAVDDVMLADYFDAIYHSSAVVGVNTSAMIEAAFAGRGVYSLLGPRYRESQDGMPHFVHLRRAGGGLVHVTSDPQEHAAMLVQALRGEGAADAADRARAFLADFIRPHGLDQPATPLLVDAIESLASRLRVRAERAPDIPQEWLDQLAAELEPVFHIRRGRSIGTRRRQKERRAAGQRGFRNGPSAG